ncbi:hypothetical protein FY034_15875 [Trichlorobacter lovleyi]|uniref:hypothetical protein n=1 Tax=Trichlorobacter lovleyi TaxID=313985 RepID=UPI00223EF6BC|nr:hypothetical protein [Trichlorobacter lovleyi]QOX80352.1 hypothetical protein FY034_15875 [Trichlorobacter lovleyi]
MAQLTNGNDRLLYSGAEDDPIPTIRDCAVLPGHGGNYALNVVWERSGRRFGASVQLQYHSPLDGVILIDQASGEQLVLSIADVRAFLANGYEFDRESPVYFSELRPELPPRIAVTVRHSTAMGGGTMALFRYVNWLTDMGAEVTVFSDDFHPRWTTLNARFRCITDDRSRYGIGAQTSSSRRADLRLLGQFRKLPPSIGIRL